MSRVFRFIILLEKPSIRFISLFQMIFSLKVRIEEVGHNFHLKLGDKNTLWRGETNKQG